MIEYVKRNDLGLTDFEIVMCDGDYKEALKMLLDKIEKAPAADVAEVKHGQWINERWEGLSSFSAECSLCSKRTLAYFHYYYCPNCGAKMDGGQDE